MRKNKFLFLLLVCLLKVTFTTAQIDTSFWFAAPWVTPDHTNRENVVMHISTFTAANTVIRLRQPAAIAPNQYDTTINIAAGQTFDYIFWRDKMASGPANPNIGFDSLEVRPANTVLPYGLYLSSSDKITVVYDVICAAPGFNNTETFSLKGQNGYGTEFVCPAQKLYRNRTVGDRANTPLGSMQPKQQIVVVATQPNTVIWVTPRCNVVGHLAGITYSVLLPSAGSCYNIENLVQDTYVNGNNLSGTIVSSDKPIAVTVADDSINNVFSSPPGPGYNQFNGMGCFDLIGDQIVPVDIVGKDYIVNRGQLYRVNQIAANNPGMKESAFIVATENQTQIEIVANPTLILTANLNKGDTYIDTLLSDLTFIRANKNVYVFHVSGYGCELGGAILPPLSCAGSSLVAFSRNSPQRFSINILCKNGAQGSFTLNGGPTCSNVSIPIGPASFTLVPGTSTIQVSNSPPLFGYYGAQINLNSTITLPPCSYSIANTTTNVEVQDFALGVFDGDLTSGGLFHYMSSFLRKTTVVTATIPPVCAGINNTVALTGTISGAALSGIWTGNGAGTINPVYTANFGTVSTIYTLSAGEFTTPTQIIRIFTLTSLGCSPKSQTVSMTINPQPVISAGTSTYMCKNNVLPLILTGAVANATTASWSGGNGGSFGVPGPNTTYTPSLADLAANTITLTLTSIGGCTNISTSVTFTFTNPPVVNPGSNTVICTNSQSLILNGSIPGYTNGIWNSSGTGLFFPNNGVPTTTYVLSISDFTLTNIVFSLTSVPNPSTGCAAETKTVVANIIPAPFISAGPDYSVCASNTVVVLSGTISGAATTGFWTTLNGGGTFPPPNAVPTATYLMGPNDPTFVTDTMILHSDVGTCPSVTDTLLIHIVSDPVITVPTNTTVCDNAFIVLSGTVTGAVNTGFWTVSPGGGAFAPSFTSLGAQYTPSAADLAAGFIVFTLHSDPTFCGLGPTKSFTVSVTKSPSAAFNFPALGRCLGSAITFTDVSALNGATPPLNYLWDFGDNTPTSIAQNPTHTFTNSGTYTISLTVTGSGCPDNITRTVNIAPVPISNFTVTNSCQGSNAIFKDLSQSLPGGGFINTWLWTFGDEALGVGPTITGIPTTTIAHIYANPSIFFAALTVSTSLGCVHTSTQSLNISAKPDAEFGMTNNPNVAQEPVFFSDFSTPTGNIFSWYWQFGDEGTSDKSGPSHSYENAGIYTIKLTVTDFNGCTDTVSKSIEINLLPQVPTAFTPNGDNNNDLLFVKGGPFDKILFRVYNNWGELLFETRDQKEGWDGTKNGVPQPVGVYVWTLDVDMYNNRQVKKNGDVSLMR